MGSDAAILNGHAPRDLGRKKKTKRSARLRQCKMDARREQWLSQSGTDNNNDDDGDNRSINDSSSGPAKGRDRPLPIYIPLSRPWRNSSEVDCSSNSLGSHSSSSSSSSGSCSRSISDADDCEDDDRGSGVDGVLDDWEAVADALTANDSLQMQPGKDGDADAANGDSLGAAVSVEKQCDPDPDPTRGILRTPREPRLILRTWKPDDAFRPQSLPNLSKQRVFSKHLATQNSRNEGWLCRNFNSQPLICPICYEELDTTDTSFFPCPCGFRLCLFCHKRILEADGRCPGCRKQYISVIGNETIVAGGLPHQYNRLAQSCSMNARR